ncbi:MAG TPA: helix-turn-helix domain-containing protein [Candidatus Acidoferrales bacterium]|jgi:DNA-binding HxlR family transcriptional regulator|nr:helix-turn-helix domain-containing protein [Candidatus Acidoferrales bacterium]
MQRASFAEMPCPVARSLDVIGEWWTLLIVRDAVLGARHFEDFKATGIADNILSARLKKLVDEGLLERKLYQKHPARYEYLLTEKGRGLAPVLVALRVWGKRWTEGGDISRLTHKGSDHEVSLRFHCDKCRRPIAAAEIEPARHPIRVA